jgi:hypothetical protein
MAKRWARMVVMAALAELPSCVGVAPYERGRLAHPTMTTMDLAGPAEAHVRTVHEGAVGGSLGVGGGCGCN